MLVFKNIEDFKKTIGQGLGTTDWLTITQDMVNGFAQSTLDFQWIHLDEHRAKQETPFGGTIAHGFLTLSLLSHFVETLFKVESTQMTINYGLDKVRFTGVVPVGSRIRLTGYIKAIEDYQNNGLKVTIEAIIEIEYSPKPVLITDWIVLILA